MKMKSCTADEFGRIMCGAGGLQTYSEVGSTHMSWYWERYSARQGWSVVGVKRQVNGEYSWEVPNFLYEAYIK